MIAGVANSTVPSRSATATASLECWTSARKRASLSPITSRARLVSVTSLVTRHPMRPAIAAMTSVSTSASPLVAPSTTTIAGTENSAAARTTTRARSERTMPGVVRGAELAHRRVEHRGREQRVRDRPQRIERTAVGVVAVDDQTREEGVGGEHRRHPREQQPGRGDQPREREHRVHERHDEHDVHDGVQHRHEPFGRRAFGRRHHGLDDPLPHHRAGGERHDRGVDQRVASTGADELPQRDREQRIGGEVEEVGVREAGLGAEAAGRDVVHDVAGRGEDDRDHDEGPRPRVARAGSGRGR